MNDAIRAKPFVNLCSNPTFRVFVSLNFAEIIEFFRYPAELSTSRRKPQVPPWPRR